MNKTIGLVWFKNDLRLLDNEVLCKAIASCDVILPVYIFDERQFKKLHLGFPKADFNRFEFLVQTLAVLRSNLKELGSNLLIKIGKPEDIIPQLISHYHIESVFAEQEYAPEELTITCRVAKNVQVPCNYIWGKTLYHIDDIPYDIEAVPLTSKAFRTNTTKKATVRTLFDIPDHIKTLDLDNWGKLPNSEDFNLNRGSAKELFMPAGEDEALKRLAYYTKESELLTSYKWTRNKSLGMDYSSKLSPYLAVGALSPRTIYFSVKEYEELIKKNISTWWLLFEVIWRDFFTFKGMRMGSSIFKTAGFKNKDLDFENDSNIFKKWCAGKTGIPFIDAHMRQLNETGFMSNRGRVNCASYLIHDLKVDWTWGASYFESKLIDYDVTSNWMNWHMQAYETWYTNPVNQSIKYDATDFLKKWIPELREVKDELIHIPWKFKSTKIEYIKPIEVYDKWSRAENKILKLVNGK